MNLLMMTRKVDRGDSNAGFIYELVKELGEQLLRGDEDSALYVICNEKGNTSGLPANTRVYSMGKEQGLSKSARVVRGEMMILKFINKVDGVFTHMIPEYALMVGPWCGIFRKKLVHWHMHKSVPKALKMANRYVSEFVTASEKSFRMKTNKTVNIFGHIIDTDRFKPLDPRLRGHDKIKVLSVSRISPSKDIETLIGAVELLTSESLAETPTGRNMGIEVKVIGGPGLKEQEEYFEGLKRLVDKKGLGEVIEFLGPIAYNRLEAYYQQADIFVNASHTGSLDKVVLEAMACGCIPVSCNEAFEDMLYKKGLMFTKGDPEGLARKIAEVARMSEGEKDNLKHGLRDEVVMDHGLKNTVGKILKLYANE